MHRHRRSGYRWPRLRLEKALGGPARLQLILMLGAVLGLSTADQGTVSAVSDQLSRTLRLGNTEIGLLLAVVSFVAAAATLPVGILADRMSRRLLLMIACAGWAAAMLLSGLAPS